MLLLLALGCDRAEDIVCLDPTLVVVKGDVNLSQECVKLVARSTVVGQGEWSVRFEQEGQVLTPVLTGKGTFEALVLDGSLGLAGEATPVLWKQGFQSWWWSGVTELSPLSWENQVPVAGGDGNGMSAIDETPGTSWWVGLLGKEDGASLLIGALSSKTTKFYTAFEDDRAVAVWGGRGERIEVDGELRLDPIFLAGGLDPWALHTEYAEAAAHFNDVVLRDPAPPTGWATWTVYYEDLTEEAVRTDLAALPPELEVVQLDDGWQVLWGDWTPNEDFPGWDTLPQDIEAAGHRPGLWMAPFYVERDIGLYDEHPDWFVHDADGEPIAFGNFGPNSYLILDVTHPDAAAFFQKNLSDRVDEGWTYFKLDFLYAGMQEGVRHQPMTGAQAYALAMGLVREAIGESFLLACGAPMLPSVGTADAYRTGADIAFGFDPDGQPEYLRWQARATAARAWQNGIWWWVDADQIMLRDPIEPTGALVAGAVSGGAWLYGDAPQDLDPRFVSSELLSLVGQTAVPESPLSFVSGPDFGPVAELGDPDDRVPTRWVFPDGTVALLNLSEQSVEVEGPGGSEMLGGESAPAGPRRLKPGTGELWR